MTANPPEQCLVLRNVSWESYLSIGMALAERPALRLTFDRGTLEIMTTSQRHERYNHWLGRFVETIAEEVKQPIMPGGSMTFQREDLKQGFEPDNCYWIANEKAVRAKLTWEPVKDPPPDLMIAIAFSPSARDRVDQFAEFHIPEIWFFDGNALRIYVLEFDMCFHYLVSEQSRAFPSIPVKELIRFFPTGTIDYLSAVAAVRAWVRSFINQTP